MDGTVNGKKNGTGFDWQSTMQKRWVKAAAGAAALVVVVVALIPLFLNADTFRPMLQDQLSSALGRKVTLGHLSFSLFSGSLAAKDVSVADDPQFSSAPFLQAKVLHIGVETGEFLFHHQVRITNFTADEPEVQLIQAQNGTWNFSSLGSAAAKPGTAAPSTMPDLTVGELKISDGQATVSTVPATSKPVVYTKLNLTVKGFSFLKSFPFQLSASLPGAGTLELTGDAGPVAEKDAANTLFHATLRCRHVDPVAAGMIDASKGISMVDDIDAEIASDGSTLTSTGKIKAAKLQLVRAGSPMNQTVDMDYKVSDDLNTRSGQVSDIAIHTGSVMTHVTGSFHATAQAIVVDLHLAAPNLPVDQVEQLLPAVGVRLPSGSSLHGGTLNANLTITGPATATVIQGPVEVDNTQLANFNLGSKIQGITPLGGGGSGGTGIQTLKASVNSNPETTQLSNIYAAMPQIGTASGSGTVSAAGALDFNLVAKLNTTSGVGAIASGALSQVGGLLGNGLHTAANNGIPLTITGTTSNPLIRANVGAILKQQTSGLLGSKSGQTTQSPAGVLKGLFGKP